MTGGHDQWIANMMALWGSGNGEGAHSLESWQVGSSVSDSRGFGRGGERSVGAISAFWWMPPALGHKQGGLALGPPPPYRESLGSDFPLQQTQGQQWPLGVHVPQPADSTAGKRAPTLSWANRLSNPGVSGDPERSRR